MINNYQFLFFSLKNLNLMTAFVLWTQVVFGTGFLTELQTLQIDHQTLLSFI